MKPLEIVIAAALVLVSLCTSYAMIRMADAPSERNRPSECQCRSNRSGWVLPHGQTGELLPAK